MQHFVNYTNNIIKRSCRGKLPHEKDFLKTWNACKQSQQNLRPKQKNFKKLKTESTETEELRCQMECNSRRY